VPGGSRPGPGRRPGGRGPDLADKTRPAQRRFSLDLEDGRHDVGLPIQVWQCNPNTSNQKWYAI